LLRNYRCGQCRLIDSRNLGRRGRRCSGSRRNECWHLDLRLRCNRHLRLWTRLRPDRLGLHGRRCDSGLRGGYGRAGRGLRRHLRRGHGRRQWRLRRRRARRYGARPRWRSWRNRSGSLHLLRCPANSLLGNAQDIALRWGLTRRLCQTADFAQEITGSKHDVCDGPYQSVLVFRRRGASAPGLRGENQNATSSQQSNLLSHNPSLAVKVPYQYGILPRNGIMWLLCGDGAADDPETVLRVFSLLLDIRACPCRLWLAAGKPISDLAPSRRLPFQHLLCIRLEVVQ
jgi:hypothetical protein